MVFSRFTSVVDRMEPMPVSDMGVVRSFLVIAGFMVPGSFAMMCCRVFVLFCSPVVVFCACMRTHNVSPLSSDDGISQPGESAVPVTSRLKRTPNLLTG